MRRTTVLAIMATLVLVACDRGAEPELTVTTRPTSSTVAVPDETTPTTMVDTTTDDAGDGTTPTTVARVAVENYTVQVQTSADDGRVLWVTIPPEDYTDLDLENFLVELIDEEEEDLWEVHVLDDVAAVDAARVAADDRTEGEQALVADHYLVSLTEGNVVTFRGPFEAAGSFLIGS